MTRKSALLFIIFSTSMALMGSGHAQTLKNTSAADGVDANSTIIRPAGDTSSKRAAHMSEASLGAASARELGGMELTLQQYRAAIENLSMVQVRQVWPSLDRRRETALKQAFDYLRAMSSKPKMGLESAPPAVIEEVTKLECRETLRYNDAKGKPQDVKPARVSISLRKQGDNWIVDTMK